MRSLHFPGYQKKSRTGIALRCWVDSGRFRRDLQRAPRGLRETGLAPAKRYGAKARRPRLRGFRGAIVEGERSHLERTGAAGALQRRCDAGAVVASQHGHAFVAQPC